MGEAGSGTRGTDETGGGGGHGDVSSDDAATPLQSPRSQNTSREEDESSNANESDCKSPSQRSVVLTKAYYNFQNNEKKTIK